MNKSLTILAWKSALHVKSTQVAADRQNKVHDDLHVEYKNFTIESCHDENDVIANKVNSSVKHLVANVLTTMVEQNLNNNSRTYYYNVQRGIRSVGYNDVEQVILDLIRAKRIGKTSEASTPRLFRHW